MTAPEAVGAAPRASLLATFASLARSDAALWPVILILAWSPFPIGSNRAWSSALLVILIAVAFLVWFAGTYDKMKTVAAQARPLRIPLAFGSVALLWGIVQVLPIVPRNWAHPVWSIAASALGRPLPATISLDPFRTETELIRLASFAMMAWLAYALARDAARARLLFRAIVVIGIFWVVYGWIFAAFGLSQFQLLYPGPDIGNKIAAPFVNRDSLATYAGLVALACLALLFERIGQSRARGRGRLGTAIAGLEFAFTRGLPHTLGTVAAFAIVVATGSLGGTLAMFSGLLAMGLVAWLGWLRARLDLWTAVVAAALVVAIAVLAALNGGALTERVSTIAASGLNEDLRFGLWSAAERMIRDAPLLGLGLGTFQDAYPLYAQNYYPFLMDHAHQDFLELAAGWGLPAALAWLSAIGFLFALCVRGIFVRRRDRVYALVAVGATVLVAVHSLVEFSLQIPAIAVLCAALLGIGVAQALPSRERGRG